MTPDECFRAAQSALVHEVRETLHHVGPDDLTALELAALAAVLRPASERLKAEWAPAAPVVKLVRKL